MHNIYELEKRWLNYKIRSYIPHAGATFVAILLLIYTYQVIILPNEKTKKLVKSEKPKVQSKIIAKNEKPKVQSKIIVKNEKPKEKKVAIKEITQVVSIEPKKVILEPSLDFIKKLRVNSINTYKPQKNRIKEIKKQAVNPPVKNISKQKTQVSKTQKKVENKQTTNITLIKQETIDDINHVIKRFKKNNNPALSLFVAKKYYKLGDYHKAYNYALITNNINKEIDASWIIFAKSLVKINKKNMAIKTLTKYIQQSNSSTARVLLDEIKSGKFK